MTSSDREDSNSFRPETEVSEKDSSNIDSCVAAGCPFLPPYSVFQPPRLGIIHLLVWIGVAAVLLKYMEGMGAFDQINDAKNPIQWFFWTAHGLLSTTIAAAVLTGGCVILWAKIRGQAGHLQPGHWILLTSTLLTIISTAIWTIGVYIEDSLGPLYEGSYPGIKFYTYQIRTAMLGTVSIPFYLFAAIRLKDALRWRVTLSSFVAGSCVCAVVDTTSILLMFFGFDAIGYQAWLFSVFPLEEIVILPIICAAVWIDFKLHARRDWLHWLGVASTLIMGAWEIVIFFLRMFLPAVNAS